MCSQIEGDPHLRERDGLVSYSVQYGLIIHKDVEVLEAAHLEGVLS